MTQRGSLASPIPVEILSEPRRLYRLCHASDEVALAGAVRSNYELGRDPRGPELVAAIIHMSLSMFETLDQAARLAGTYPKIGGFAATFDLVNDRGLCIAKTGRSGHWSVWGQPAQLLACLVEVVELRG